jgi:peroxiredoxin family protein
MAAHYGTPPGRREAEAVAAAGEIDLACTDRICANVHAFGAVAPEGEGMTAAADLTEALEEAAAEAPEPEKEKMVLIAASGDLDKAWPVMILATTGAAYGMDVTVFFTFWGLSILKKPDSGVTGEDWRQKMLSVFSGGSPEKLGLSKLNFAGMGPAMMKGLADKHNVASVQELMDLAIDMGVKLWPCQMTMDLMGIDRADLIDGLDEPAGAGSAISLMKQAEISLFI